ncbi:MAG: hypothetical protein GY822_25815 [Deltaproteobacteria bacterium]|nr:hypothetical protein [Deltaproteobacteria bacterium]
MSVTRSKVAGRLAGLKGYVSDNLAGLIQVTLAGASFDDPQALNPLSLFGKAHDVEVDLEGLSPQFNAKIPRALLFRLGATRIAPGFFVAQAQPGSRLPWSLGHSVRLADFGSSDLARGIFANEEIDEAKVIDFFFDHYGNNKHGFSATRSFQLQNTADTADWGDFPFVEINDGELDHTFSAWWNISLPVPSLPCLQTDPIGCVHAAQGAMVMAAVDVPGRGMVPFALNSAKDGLVNVVNGVAETPVLDGEVQSLTGKLGKISLTSPPPHDGLEGYPTAQIISAWDPNDVTFSRLSTSALVRVGEDLQDERPIASTFVQVQSGSIYGEEIRLFEHFLRGEADVFRAELEGDDGKWTLYYDRNYAENALPLSLTSLHPPEKDGREDDLDLHAMRLREAPQDDFRSFSSVGMPRILPLLDGWSHVSCQTSVEERISTCGDFD